MHAETREARWRRREERDERGGEGRRCETGEKDEEERGGLSDQEVI
jgi:hypothetical protein